MDPSPMRGWRKDAGLTQEDLAKYAEVATLTVVRNEQGLYTEPSGKIIWQLIHAGVGPFDLNPGAPWLPYSLEYRRAQNHHRYKTDWSIGDIPSFKRLVVLKEHPFIIWRKSLDYSKRLTFCRAACVSPPQVLSFEMCRQRAMPTSLYFGLQPFVPHEQWEQLVTVSKQYYDWKIHGYALNG